MSEEKRMGSWHLVVDGDVYSGGAAAAPLLGLLPGGRPLAPWWRRVPGVSDRAYRLVARNRDRFGRLAGTRCEVDPQARRGRRRESRRPSGARVVKRRRLGWILAGLGVFLAVYAATVVLWRDPATDLYARWKQHTLSQDLDEAFAAQEPIVDFPAGGGLEHYTQQGGAARHREARRRPRHKRSSTREAQARKGARPHHGAPHGFEGRVRARDSLGPPICPRGQDTIRKSSLPGVGRTMAIVGHRTTLQRRFGTSTTCAKATRSRWSCPTRPSTIRSSRTRSSTTTTGASSATAASTRSCSPPVALQREAALGRLLPSRPGRTGRRNPLRRLSASN